MAEEKIFELFLLALQKNKDVHFNIVWGTMAFLVTAIGWLLTSEKAREFLSTHDFVRNFCIVSILVVAATHYYMLYDTYCKSMELVEAINNNKFYIRKLNNELVYSFFELRPRQVLFRAAFTVILFTILVYSLLWLKNDKTIKT